MARRREVAAPRPEGREFTADEVERIRAVIGEWSLDRGHPHPGATVLEGFHAAAGRRRGFKLWQLDPPASRADVERATEEEIAWPGPHR